MERVLVSQIRTYESTKRWFCLRSDFEALQFRGLVGGKSQNFTNLRFFVSLIAGTNQNFSPSRDSKQNIRQFSTRRKFAEIQKRCTYPNEITITIYLY